MPDKAIGGNKCNIWEGEILEILSLKDWLPTLVIEIVVGIEERSICIMLRGNYC